MIWGSCLIGLSIVGGTIGSALTLSRLDLNDIGRDVVISGSEVATVPDTVRFQVTEPLSAEADDEMWVGVAIDADATSVPDCDIVDATGASLSQPPGAATALNSSDTDDWTVMVRAELAPGLYQATCEAGASADSAGTEFTVGRTNDHLFDNLAPVFAFLGVGAVAGGMFIVGVVLLVVGLIAAARSRRQPDGPPMGPPGGYPQPLPPVWGQPVGPPSDAWGSPPPPPDLPPPYRPPTDRYEPD